MAKTNAAFMSGVPELLVLRLLTREEMYGYQLVQAIRIVSGDVFNLAEGVVYPALHSLEARGFLKAREKLIDGRTRIYYTVTARGRERLAELTAEWEHIAGGIRSVLGGQHG